MVYRPPRATATLSLGNGLADGNLHPTNRRGEAHEPKMGVRQPRTQEDTGTRANPLADCTGRACENSARRPVIVERRGEQEVRGTTWIASHMLGQELRKGFWNGHVPHAARRL